MKTILIAEDDSTTSSTLQKALTKKGLNVVTTGNGIDVAKLLKEHKPNVMLLDVNLPGLSGLRVLEDLKREPVDTKVIVITGTFDSETEKKASDLGAYAFLKKPFMIEVVYKLLADLNAIE